VAVPAGLRGSSGSLNVAGGADAGDDGDGGSDVQDPGCITDPSSCGAEPAASTFRGLLGQLAGGVHNNDVVATLVVDGPNASVRRTTRVTAPQVVSGALTVPVTVVA